LHEKRTRRKNLGRAQIAMTAADLSKESFTTDLGGRKVSYLGKKAKNEKLDRPWETQLRLSEGDLAQNACSLGEAWSIGPIGSSRRGSLR